MTRSCAMMTVKPNSLAAGVCDWMPVILEPAQFASWLAGKVSPDPYEPFSEGMLNMYPVSRRLKRSRAREADKTLIELELPDRRVPFTAAERGSRETERLKPQ